MHIQHICKIHRYRWIFAYPSIHPSMHPLNHQAIHASFHPQIHSSNHHSINSLTHPGINLDVCVYACETIFITWVVAHICVQVNTRIHIQVYILPPHLLNKPYMTCWPALRTSPRQMAKYHHRMCAALGPCTTGHGQQYSSIMGNLYEVCRRHVQKMYKQLLESWWRGPLQVNNSSNSFSNSVFWSPSWLRRAWFGGSSMPIEQAVNSFLSCWPKRGNMGIAAGQNKKRQRQTYVLVCQWGWPVTRFF